MSKSVDAGRPSHFSGTASGRASYFPSQYALDVAPLDAGLRDVYGCADDDGIVIRIVAIRHLGIASASVD
jgi:hypothetical protein